MTIRCRYTSQVAAALLTSLLLGCDSLLDAEDPDVIFPENLASAQGATAQYNGALAGFALAMDGSSGIVNATALLSDEFVGTATSPEFIDLDTRNVQPENTIWTTTYRGLHSARLAALTAAHGLIEFPSGVATDPRIGEMYGIASLMYTLLAEDYCSGAPASFFNGDEIIYGEPQTTQQLLEQAVALADSALSFSGTASRALNLARIVKGRALLNLNQPAAAALAVSDVPGTFGYFAEHSTTTTQQQNGIWGNNTQNRLYSVANHEGGNGLDFVNAADPRVPTAPAGLGQDGVTQGIKLLTYSGPTTPVRIAGGTEARLIEAEAALAAGNPTLWLSLLNALRSGLTPLADPGTAAGRVDLQFRERAFWLYATGHRLGDLRRLIRQYGRAADAVFPVGSYHKLSRTYGSDINLVIPFVEANNPRFNGCLNRGA